MTLTKVFTARGVRELDFDRCLIELLHHDLSAYARRPGCLVSHIAFNFNRKHETMLDDQRMLERLRHLESIKMVKQTTDEKGQVLWSLRGYPPFTIKQPRQQTAKMYIGKVKYTKEGWARLILPKQLVEKLGKPQKVTFQLGEDKTSIVIWSLTTFDNGEQV